MTFFGIQVTPPHGVSVYPSVRSDFAKREIGIQFLLRIDRGELIVMHPVHDERAHGRVTPRPLQQIFVEGERHVGLTA